MINAAPYLKFNRSHAGKVKVGETLPLDTLELASLDGQLTPLRAHLKASTMAANGTGKHGIPTLVVAGSIT